MIIWILLIIVPMLFGLYAQMKIRRAYARNVEIPSRGHIRGVEAAEAVMRSAGISDVEIVEVPGELTDHYDPMNNGWRCPITTITARVWPRWASPPMRRATRSSTRSAMR